MEKKTIQTEEKEFFSRSMFFSEDGLTPIWLESEGFPDFDRLMRGKMTAWKWLCSGESLLKWTMGLENKRTVKNIVGMRFTTLWIR